MAWIESHQSLLTHRKTLALAAALKTNRYQVIGHLHALWWWALDNVPPDGSLAGIEPSVIESAAGWSKKGTPFIAALQQTGFVHDGYLNGWHDYGGKLQERREADAKRKRDVRRTSEGHLTDGVRREEKSTQEKRTQHKITAEAVGDAAIAFRLFEQSIGQINPHNADKLTAMLEDYGLECLTHCFAEASELNKRSLRYVEAICVRHKAEGCFTGAEEEVAAGDDWLARRYRDGKRAEEMMAQWNEQATR